MAYWSAVILLVGSLCAVPSTASIDANDWSYHGADKTSQMYWPGIPGSYCGGSEQSPIDIVTSQTVDATTRPFNLDSYDTVIDVTLENNGHAPEVLMNTNPTAKPYDVTGGGLKGTFRAYQFHFHFGSDKHMGSEHTIDGHHYPAEMHIVHYDTAYPSASEALKVKGGIAVLGVFLKEGNHNAALDKILDEIKDVEQPHTSKGILSFRLSDLLPSSTASFWRYDGSLTTPLCNQVVIWTLFKTPISISKEQLTSLRTLVSSGKDSQGHDQMMQNNFRRVQSLNGRQVYSVNE